MNSLRISMLNPVVLFVFLLLAQPSLLALQTSVASPATPVKPPAQLSPAESGRRHPAYQIFAQNLQLPDLTALEPSTIRIANQITIDTTWHSPVSNKAKESLARQFSVPPAVIAKFLKDIPKNGPSPATNVLMSLRTTITDYKFLFERLSQYRPSADLQKSKTDALQALDSGELDKAWEIYLSLPRPSAPTNLRVVPL